MCFQGLGGSCRKKEQILSICITRETPYTFSMVSSLWIVTMMTCFSLRYGIIVKFSFDISYRIVFRICTCSKAKVKCLAVQKNYGSRCFKGESISFTKWNFIYAINSFACWLVRNRDSLVAVFVTTAWQIFVFYYIPLYLAQLNCIWKTGPVLGTLVKDWYIDKLKQGLPRWSGMGHAAVEEGLRHQRWFSLGQRQFQKDLTSTLSIWEGLGREV